MVTIEEILEIGKKAEKLVNGPQKEWTEFVNENNEKILEAEQNFSDYFLNEEGEAPEFFILHYEDDDAWRRDKLNSLSFEEYCEFEHPNIMSDYSYSVFDGYQCLGSMEFGTSYIVYKKLK